MKAMLGFDGFVDKLARVISKRDATGGQEQEYKSITSFAERISAAAGISCDLELRTLSVVPGGNAPNMARALSAFGIKTTLIATVGDENLHPVFSGWEPSCKMIPVGKPADTMALEFCDGKIMLADLSPFREITWQHIVNKVGLANFKAIAEGCDLYALTCYSLLPHADEIFTGFRQDILSAIHPSKRRPLLFFDLADLSKHDDSTLHRCARILQAYRTYGETILGLNANEANCLMNAFGISDERYMQERLAALYQIGIADTLLVHPRDRCYVVDERGVREHMGILVKNPVRSTGGGDYLNAGFSAARLYGYGNDDAANIAMEISREFV